MRLINDKIRNLKTTRKILIDPLIESGPDP